MRSLLSSGVRAWGIRSVLVVLTLVALSAKPATAATMLVGYLSEGSSYQQLSLDSSRDGTTTDIAPNVIGWKGSSQGTAYNLMWDLTLDSDPSVAGSVAITNNSGVPTTFTLTVGQPVAPAVPAGAPMFGSSAISVSDANGNSSATLSAPAGSAIYNALINGAVQRQLFTPVYSLAPAAIPGAVAVDSRNFSGEFTTLNLSTEIGLRHHFTLSPGDSATMNSTFTVVPEPATVSLALLGALGLAVSQFRRRIGR